MMTTMMNLNVKITKKQAVGAGALVALAAGGVGSVAAECTVAADEMGQPSPTGGTYAHDATCKALKCKSHKCRHEALCSYSTSDKTADAEVVTAFGLGSGFIWPPPASCGTVEGKSHRCAAEGKYLLWTSGTCKDKNGFQSKVQVDDTSTKIPSYRFEAAVAELCDDTTKICHPYLKCPTSSTWSDDKKTCVCENAGEHFTLRNSREGHWSTSAKPGDLNTFFQGRCVKCPAGSSFDSELQECVCSAATPHHVYEEKYPFQSTSTKPLTLASCQKECPGEVPNVMTHALPMRNAPGRKVCVPKCQGGNLAWKEGNGDASLNGGEGMCALEDGMSFLFWHFSVVELVGIGAGILVALCALVWGVRACCRRNKGGADATETQKKVTGRENGTRGFVAEASPVSGDAVQTQAGPGASASRKGKGKVGRGKSAGDVLWDSGKSGKSGGKGKGGKKGAGKKGFGKKGTAQVYGNGKRGRASIV